MLPRLLYTLALYLLTPLVMLRLAARGVRYHDYFGRWRERFGFFAPPTTAGAMWVHAVSVGEVNAAVPLVEALLAQHPERPLLLTTVTPTGSARVRQLFGARVFHVYLPYDLPGAVRRFLARVRPCLGVIVETEIWPNLYAACARARVPIVIANARLSQRSMRGYWPGRTLIRTALRSVAHVAAQTRADAQRYGELGVPAARISVVGNLKYDMPPPHAARLAGAAMRRQWGPARPVWIAASTHEPEELAVLQAHLAVLRRLPDALLLIAPRHPERFRPVEQAARSLGFAVATRQAERLPSVPTQCFVIDTLGELLDFYAAAEVAFVAGSLAPIGGHNVLEPAALAVPVLVGPHTFNFEEITDALLAAGAARRIADAAALGPAVLAWLGDAAARAQAGAAGVAVIEQGRGALAATLAPIEQLLREGRCTESARAAPARTTSAGR